ncbi:MAG TPA: hypothetical protein VHE35_06320 [Kofleriaceae bacterium]|nr:hypothetical protein [Kofleriaceae bacterium]
MSLRLTASTSLALVVVVVGAGARDRAWCGAGVAGVAAAGPRTPRAYPEARAIVDDPMTSPYRVHVARMGAARVTVDGDDAGFGGHDVELARELPVAEERGDRVRVLFEDDDARMLLWLDAADLAWSIARPVRLAGRGDAGVWLGTGAPVTVTGSGRRRTVAFDDGTAKVSGAVDAGELARVFPASRGLEPTWTEHVGAIRAAPGGAVLYRGELDVEVVARRAGWAEVEHRSRYLRIRGWVAEADLAEGGFGTGGTGSGSGFGMSDTERVDVAAGACLYDAKDGHVAGLEVTAAQRYVAERDGAWWALYVGTPWGVVQAWAHADGEEAPGRPLFDRCAPATIAPSVDDAP